jgi:YD repeat-containing protein
MKAALLSIALTGLCVLTTHAQTSTPSPTNSAAVAEKIVPTVATGEVKVGKAAALALPPEKANPVKLVLFDKPPTIDGKLDDEVWKSAALLKDFYQTQPGDNLVPLNRTEVRLGYDTRFLYIAFHCFDDPTKVRANVAKRDNIWDDDYVGILFDTFNDQRRAYEFNFNPLGIQADGIWTEGQGEDFSLDLVMESKGLVTTDGYTIEVAIPFKSLRYVAGKDKLWGVHFWRRTKRLNNSLDMWIPMDRDKSSWLSQAGHLTGFDGISTERTLELIPSLTVSQTSRRVRTFGVFPSSAAAGTDPGRMLNEPVEIDPGLSGKYTLTPTVTLDFAINPDFAQVEADQLVVTANQRFPIFFEEKRPFFLEGIDIFSTQIAAVHTRAIIDPDFATKLTGKVGRNTFGLLLASDNGPGNFSDDERISANPRFVDKNANVGILRLKRDVGKSDSFIGFLATYHRFVDRYNELGGFDGRFRLNKQTTFSWQALGTHSRNRFFFPEEGVTRDSKQNGFIYAVNYDQSGRHFGQNISMVGRTRYYRADVGFNRRVNTNNPNWFVRYNSEPKPKAKLISWRAYNSAAGNFDWQGRSQYFINETQIQFTLRRQTYFGVGLDKGYERVFESEFGPKRKSNANCSLTNTCTFAGDDNERSTPNTGVYFFGGSSPSKKYNFNFFVNRVWGAMDFDFGAGQKFPRVSPQALVAAEEEAAGRCQTIPRPARCLSPFDPGPGDFWHFDAGVTYQPTSAINARFSYVKERLTRYDTDRLAFDQNLLSLRTTYQFTRFLFARGRVDYDTLAANVRGQFLLGWTPNPGTAFYAGYNDDLNRNGFSPLTRQLEPGFRRNGRTFFIKMSYLFRRSF